LSGKKSASDRSCEKSFFKCEWHTNVNSSISWHRRCAAIPECFIL
jgi:hypothetical protein